MTAVSRPLDVEVTVETVATVAPDVAVEFLAIYRAAFAPLERLAPARQALTDEEFLDEMQDPSVIKFVARDGSGWPTAMAFMATDLSIVPWISLPYYAEKFPEHYQRGALYYFGSLLVRPECQGGPWSVLLLEELVRRMDADRAVAAFDCCGFVVDRVRLPELIARVTSAIAYVDVQELDSQRYFAYTVEGMR